MNEVTARIKINKLLEAAGWRFFADGDSPANICLEPNVAIRTSESSSALLTSWGHRKVCS